LAFDPDGDWLAASQCLDYGEPVLLMDPVTLRLLRGLNEATRCGRALSTDGSGTHLAVGSSAEPDGNVLVVDLGTKEVISRMQHPGSVTSVALEPSGRRLLTVGTDGTGRVWDAFNGKPLHVLRGHRGAVTAAVWSPDGSTLLTSGVDGTVRSFDPDTGDPGVVLDGLGGQAALAMTPDGRRLVTASGGQAQVWAWASDDIVDLAHSRVERTFTTAECEQYRIPDCPAA
jgi:WD40 repeat protein